MRLNREILQSFNDWFAAASAAGIAEPEAMTLSTLRSDGRGVSARTVLLKAVDESGFVFYTNTQSRKGRQIAAHDAVALVFFWQKMARQVLIEGAARPVTAAEADAYFATRPHGSQIGAWASAQSAVLDTRQTLERRVAEFKARFAGAPVPRPPHWSGYRVDPIRVEFWQGREDRLHDRHCWTVEDEKWMVRRLYP